MRAAAHVRVLGARELTLSSAPAGHRVMAGRTLGSLCFSTPVATLAEAARRWPGWDRYVVRHPETGRMWEAVP